MSETDSNSFLSRIDTIAKGLSKTFSPFYEVVTHNLKNPEYTALSIHDNLFGHQSGQPATGLDLTRIVSLDFPSVIANCSNQFVDDRPVKDTPVDIKDEDGEYVATLCLNVDTTPFRGV